MSRFKVYYQHDAMQCGIACLQMICKHYGREYTLCGLSNVCHATKEGVSLFGISEAAVKLGLKAVGCRLTADQLCSVKLPCILHWNQNHFVVLYRVCRNGRRFCVADPSRGLVNFTREEMEEHWVSSHSQSVDKGIAMIIDVTPKFYSSGIVDVENGGERSLKYLSKYLWMYRKYLAQIMLGLVAGCLMQLLLPFLTQSIVDVGIKGKNIGFVWLVLIGELVLMTSRTLIDFIRRWLLLHINMRINISLVSDFIIKLMRLPMAFFDTKLMGDLLQRMGDHSRVNAFLTQQTLGIALSFITFVIFGIVLAFYSLKVFVIFFAGSVVYAMWLLRFMGRRKQLDYEFFEKLSDNSSKTFELVTSMQEIKLQGCQLRRRWEWEDVQAGLYDIQMKGLRLQQMQEAGSLFVNELKNIVITVVAATAVMNDEMTFGMMLAVQYIIGQLEEPVSQIMSFIYSWQDVRISLERINEIHMLADEDSKPDGNIVSGYVCGQQGISLCGVNFKYDQDSHDNTLDGISMQVPRGKVTAIVGASGSGKTTLVKLMLGYYPIKSGSIKICGTEMSDINLQWWRSRCGVVMQDGVIFSDTIARNIAVADGDIDESRLDEAARAACIDGFIMSLPLKYDTKVGRDGMGLSKGQCQRLLIARAVYKNPDFIFLDEATNSLDAKNEQEIVYNLARFYEGRTVVVVAHRLSTVKSASQIVVMDNGRIAECGTHLDLVRRKGVYYGLVKNQLELCK